MSAQKVVAVTFKGVPRLWRGKFYVLDDYRSLIYRIGGHSRVRWSHMKVWLWYGPRHGYWTWKTWATAQDETLFWIGWTLCQKSKYLIIATTRYGNKDWWKDYGLNIFLNLAGREAVKKEKIWSFGYSTIIHSSDHTIWFLAESRESFLVFQKKLLKAVMLIEITQIKYKEIKGIWAVSSLSCQPQMQIWCSKLKDELIEDNCF